MHTTAQNARKKLLKYYCKVTLLYSITSALDPRINMHYFCREKWKKSLINEWKIQMESIWEAEYKPVNAVIIHPFHDADDFINSIYEKKQRVDGNDELEWWVLLCFLVGWLPWLIFTHILILVIC